MTLSPSHCTHSYMGLEPARNGRSGVCLTCFALTQNNPLLWFSQPLFPYLSFARCDTEGHMVLDKPGPLNLAGASLPHLCCCIFLVMEAIKKSYMVGMLTTDSDLLFLLGPPNLHPMQMQWSCMLLKYWNIFFWLIFNDCSESLDNQWPLPSTILASCSCLRHPG